MTSSLWRRWLAGGVLALLGGLALFAAGAGAQHTPACTVSGYVLDPQGRGVPQATVTLKLSGRASASQVVSDLDGSYALEVQPPALTAQDAGYLYTELPLSGEVLVGAVHFKNCRIRRDIFTNTPADAAYTPGPTPPAPPPVPPAYPAPGAPSAALAKSLAFFDLTALPRGGVSPGEHFSLPVCLAAFDAPLPQVSKLTFIAEFDPARLRVKGFRPIVGAPFSNNPIRATIEREMVQGRERGRIWYEVPASGLVELPQAPSACLRVVDVDMEAIAAGVQPGDSLGLSTVRGRTTNPVQDVDPSLRIGGFEQPLARTTTYVDILTAAEQNETLKKSYLPLLARNNSQR